jgi:putative transposase
MIVKPETVVGWHRAGFRLYWRWKSRPCGGRPRITPEVRALIRRLAQENTDWGAPKIHGELQKLGFVLSERTVARYLPGHGGVPMPASNGSHSFIITARRSCLRLLHRAYRYLRVLYCILLPSTNVASIPQAVWVVQQLRERFAEAGSSRYATPDHDSIFTTT